ncbi:hypothetical protein [Fibrobacter sp.]|uniref:hypothetical protein n=1 Tax=Fibrobacter sp. TaxID=35828 RepID=UPI0025BDEC19|nr:hypothetical protein [Fibrobacter sp.]MBR3073481.1 hypothetical protein [Fibrobacter sp.]
MSNLDERTLASSLQTRDEREKMAYHAKMKEAISLVPRLSSLLQTDNLRRVFSETGENLEILKGVLDERTLASSLQTRDEREKMAYHAKIKEAISLVPRLSSLVSSGVLLRVAATRTICTCSTSTTLHA